MMADWADYVKQTQITFRTPAPADAPEVKGYRCYFEPEWLEWSVRPGQISVRAFGPPTRTSAFSGEMRWDVEGRHGDTRPAWLPLPVALLAAATFAVERIERERKGENR